MKNQKKIKVLFRLRSLEMGGIQKVTLDLLQHLPRDRFELTLLLNLYQGELKNEVPKDVALIYLAKGKEDFSKNSYINKFQLVVRKLHLMLYETFPKFFFPLKLKKKYDIEIASSYIEFDSVLNSTNKNSKKIAWYHNDVTYDKNPDLVMERARKMKQFDHVVFCAQKIREKISSLYGFEFPNSSVIYNAVHKDEIVEKSKEFEVDFKAYNQPIFICVGRLDEKKAYDRLMDVHAQLLQEGYQHSIIILGEGPERELLEKKIKSLQVSKTFHLLGVKRNPYPYIKKADFFLLCSQSEAYPLVLKEALSLEKPIIATDVGGVSEIIDNQRNGLLIEPNDEALYSTMKKIMENPQISLDLAKGVRETSDSKLSTQDIYNQLVNLLVEQYKATDG